MRGKIPENVGTGRRAHPLGGIEILDAERNAFERSGLAFGELFVGFGGHGQRLIGRFQHIGIERTRLFHRRQMHLGQLAGRNRFGAKRITGFGKCQLCQIGHATSAF